MGKDYLCKLFYQRLRVPERKKLKLEKVFNKLTKSDIRTILIEVEEWQERMKGENHGYFKS